ncbi:hypothetical protein QQX98_009527 [Neonectria punicea]|uniref:Aspartate/glutamate/uridylate kinase domain-containing protein n=1 Tax=Neonectria punicea TaxID=979145 RepID=A0ABR1GSF4_9HYPO
MRKHKTFGKGTNLSCILMAALLQDRGVDAQYVDLGDAISRDLPPALRQEIVSCDKRVPVMTSLFEGIPGGPNNAIGKSPIDLCAASVAAGVGAQELQIWAEVDGFFTVDPRRVPGARLIPSVTPSEATQLLSHSSKDIQAFAIEQAIRARIPVCIKNVLNPHGSGTMISLDDVIDAPSCIGTSSTLTAGCKDSVQKQSSFNFAPTSHSKRPTAITIKDRIMVLNVHSNKLTSAHGFLMYLFRVLDKWNLSVHSDPSSLPANVKLQLGNVLEPFPEEMLGKYDLVRVKLLYAALKKDEWLLAARNLKTLLKPGGYLFWSEIGAYGYASNPYSEAFHEWKRIESEAAVKLGRDPKCPVLLPYQFRQAGFEGVDEKVFVTLGRPDLINIITKMALFYMPQNLNGLLKLGVMSPDLTEGKVNSLVETVTKETENGVEIGTNFHWVWGQNLGSS